MINDEITGINIHNGIKKEGRYLLPKETAIALFLNGRHLTTLTCSPYDQKTLITGYLYTEQLIKQAGEIESIRIEKNRVSIITTNIFSGTLGKKTILSGCGSSVSYIDTKVLPHLSSGWSVPYQVLLKYAKFFEELTRDKASSGRYHAILADSNEIITQTTDIGRHNTIDRVIGYAQEHSIDLSKTILFTSGRISSEIIRKVLVGGIHCILSQEGVTTLSIRIGEETGVCIIGNISSEKMTIFSHSDKICI